MSDDNFLSRWSRRKIAARTGAADPGEEAVPAQNATVATPKAQPDDAGGVPAQAGTQVPGEPLPPVESLTPDSDFAAFMKPEVDPALQRQAFKKLMEDPRYNVMDGLDVYIDDYSKADPLPEGWLEKMTQVKHLGIFSEPEAAPEKAPDGGNEVLEKAISDPPVALPPEVRPSSAAEAKIPPPEVGKSEVSRGGV